MERNAFCISTSAAISPRSAGATSLQSLLPTLSWGSTRSSPSQSNRNACCTNFRTNGTETEGTRAYMHITQEGITVPAEWIGTASAVRILAYSKALARSVSTNTPLFVVHTGLADPNARPTAPDQILIVLLSDTLLK